MPSDWDNLFVELALKNHLLSKEEADQALADTSATPGKNVGALLVEKGILQARHVESLKKKVEKLLDERKTQDPRTAAQVDRDAQTVVPSADGETHGPGAAPSVVDPLAELVFFGQIGVKLGHLAQDDVDKALARQAQLQAMGARRRLGEILADQKKLTADKAREILAYQEKFILACPRCMKRWNVSGSTTSARCPVCSGALAPATSIASLRVSGSAIGVPGSDRMPSQPPQLSNSQQSGARLTTRQKKSEADPAGLLNTEFNGHQIEKVLGRGGMGCVYLATQTSLNRKVALKVMLRAGAAKEEEKARFRREMRILANVRHRYILPVYLAGIDDDLWWYTMKFVKGRSFKDALGSGKFAISRGARVVAKVAQGMDFAHKNAVIHRDLKPQNVMLERDDTADENDANAREEPQILDFGLAKSLDAQTMANLTQMGAFLGTPAYMAPEQAGGDPSQIDGRADVYALGAILYEVLTGRPPFTGSSAANVIKKVLSEEPLPPTKVFAQSPAALEPVCLRALKKDRDQRYPTAGELAAAIEAVLGPETEPPPSSSSGSGPSQSGGSGEKQTKKGLFGKLFGG